MGTTSRQTEILNNVVAEYINSARPVSSQLLEKKYDFGIGPASIRIEMQKLTDKGYLFQPHTSAGRVPTDKGYRFFVDELLEKEINYFDIADWLKNEMDDSVKFLQSLTKKLAVAADALVLSYLEKEKIFWKEGWEEVLREPEFEEKEYIINFAKFLENFEKKVAETSFFSRLPTPSRGSAIDGLKINSEIKIYIGKENPWKSAKDFSIIISKCCLPDNNEEGIISLLGPKRMTYEKNIGLMNSLIKLLENY